MTRVENSIRNLRYGMAAQLVDAALKFVMRTALVKVMGDAVVGLNGLFTEVLAMLALAELGVGSAITYSLYKPLSQGDDAKVASLMALFKRAYRLIALVIFAIGLALMPWIHLLVNKVDFEISYIRLIYLLFLISTAASYLFTYKSALFGADQKSYMTRRVSMCVDAGVTLIKIGVLYIFNSFIAFLLADILGRIVNNLLLSWSANRAYPYLREKATMPDKEERSQIFKNIAHLFIGKLSGKVTSSTDNMLISVMDSTIAVGLYSNYSMVLNSARGVLIQFIGSTTGSIGNLMATEDGAKSYLVLKRLTMLMFMIGSVACAGFFVGLSPLVKVWLGDTRVLSDAILRVLLINFFFYAIREPLWQFTSVAGLFAKDKNISIAGTVVNLILSVILGYRLGMLGIFIGTTATLTIQYVLKARLICRERFNISPRGFYAYTALFLLVAVAACALCKALTDMIPIGNAWLSLIVRVALAAALTLALDLLVFCRTDEMRYYRILLRSRLARYLPFMKKGDKGEAK